MKFKILKSTADEMAKRKASTRARTGKAKGRAFEGSVAEDIATALEANPEDVKRTPASIPGRDIVLHHSLRKRFPYAIECKNTKTLAVPAWIEQAQANADGDAPIPVIVFKLHRNSKKYAIVPFDHFLALTQEVYDAVGRIPTEDA